MVKVRQDAWSHEDDLLLAETVLRHIREGSTQLNAFEEVGDALNRTSAACGFRWNAEVRMKYDNAISLAKRQRKEKKRASAGKGKIYPVTDKKISEYQPPEADRIEEADVELSSINDTELAEDLTNKVEYSSEYQQMNSHSIDEVINDLKAIKKDYYTSKQSKQTAKELQDENERLKNHINELDQTLTKTKEQLNKIQDEYQVFMEIMDRARKMTVLEDDGTLKAPSFRMDKNGNLQEIAEKSN